MGKTKNTEEQEDNVSDGSSNNSAETNVNTVGFDYEEFNLDALVPSQNQEQQQNQVQPPSEAEKQDQNVIDRQVSLTSIGTLEPGSAQSWTNTGNSDNGVETTGEVYG